MNDGRGIVYGVILGVCAWLTILALLYAFTRVISFVAGVYEQDATPHLMLIDRPTVGMSDRH